MNQSLFERELDKSVAASERVFAGGGVQFDGDPHWDRAMKALGDAAVAEAEKVKNATAQAGSTS